MLKRTVRIVGGLMALALTAFIVTLLVQSTAASHAWRDAARDIKASPRIYDMTIVRDDWGVPTIYGANDPDTAYGLAYAHAQDDFPTLQERLAVVRGNLGRMSGAEGAKADYLSHLTDSRGQTERGYNRLSPESLAMARAYADGINAYAVAHPGEVALSRLFPVREEDIVEGFVLISPLFFGLDGVISDLVDNRNLDLSETFGPQSDRGSNAFAVAPSRMADGSTVLISNSHQPWTGVVAWYEARVASGEGWSMSGVTFPGVPTILMGHNEHLGWTNTVNAPDLVDVYALELDGSGNRYRYDGEWRDLERHRIWLRVKVGPVALPIPQWVERSVHGPVIRNDEGAFAFRYGSMGETRHLDQYYRLMRTTNLDEWREVMAMQAIPGTNFIYADKSGNVGMLYNAAFPERDPSIDWSGVLPGDRPELVWETYEPPEDIPFQLNPPAGFVFNSNHTPLLATAPEDDFTADDFPDLVGIEDRVTNRGLRSQILLSADESITMDELLAIKMDSTVERDSEQGRKLAEVIAASDEEVRGVMEDWDWNFDGHGPGDALALVMLHHVWPSTYFDVEAPSPAEVAVIAKDHMLEHYGTLEVALEEVLRVRYGDVDMGTIGGPGVLRAMHSKVADDGRFVGWNGDSYVMFVQWPADGSTPDAVSVMPHGSHPRDPAHPHHADQVELFATGRYKPAPLPRYEDRPQ